MNSIMDGLDHPRKRPVVMNKLLELGLIQDKKEMRKRKRKGSGEKSGRRRSKKSQDVESDDDIVESEEEETEALGVLNCRNKQRIIRHARRMHAFYFQ